MSTIFETIRRDHEKVRTLLDKLVECERGNERAQLLADAVRQIRCHHDAEEKSLYHALMTTDRADALAQRSVETHRDLDLAVGDAMCLDPASDDFVIKARAMRDKIVKHLDDEEKRTFPVASFLLSPEALEGLVETYERLRERAETLNQAA